MSRMRAFVEIQLFTILLMGSLCRTTSLLGPKRSYFRSVLAVGSATTCRPRHSSLSIRGSFDPENQKPSDSEEGNFSLEEFLDKPFFDPDAYDENDSSLLGKLASFVKSDYELAETIFAGSLFVILLLITQELLRMQLYGDSYVPFARGGGGRLF